MNIGIIGATGAVGKQMLKCIIDMDINYKSLNLYASKNSEGKLVEYKENKYVVKKTTEVIFKDLDIALFAISSELSKILYPFAKENNCLVIDNSSAFRLSDNVPLIIPEVNPEDIKKNKGIIANPNCSTILMNVAIWEIYKKFGIKRLVVSTYQAASGAGQEGMEELELQGQEYYAKQDIKSKNIFGKQYVWNVFSHNSSIDMNNGYNEEELKMINETKKIFKDEKLKISVTCVRVPVFRSHCETINITLKTKATENQIRETLNDTMGIEILDDRKNNNFPEPIISSNKYNIYVGRIRKDLGQEDNIGYELFISGDQILKGAALNAVQILKEIN
ncbi:Semialdehyde dehydrogenase, dimerisation domain [seawater metagenome]|uniref:aspartate-semialdehyde dehydrogenase n=1 Tax=seawater metagenome TaxID=1561972 RepID=A0A5E8CJW1_9ZZZZ